VKSDVVGKVDGLNPLEEVGKVVDDTCDGNIGFVCFLGEAKRLVYVPFVIIVRCHLSNDDQFGTIVTIGQKANHLIFVDDSFYLLPTELLILVVVATVAEQPRGDKHEGEESGPKCK